MKYKNQLIQPKIMKLLLTVLLMFGLAQEFQAQSNTNYHIKSSSLGSSGSSQIVETSKGRLYISQSLGQASVIGTHHNNGYYLRQGYQQPSNSAKAVKDLDIKLRAKVYPNPFSQRLFISFSDTIINDVSVQLFDVEARMIYTEEFLPAQKVELQLQGISSGTYFLKVASGKKLFNTKLIKI